MQRLLSCQHAKNADGWTNRQTDGFSASHTRYIWQTISLVNWDIMHICRHFNFDKQDDIECTLFITHMIISSTGMLAYIKFGNQSQIFQTAKIKSPPNVLQTW